MIFFFFLNTSKFYCCSVFWLFFPPFPPYPNHPHIPPLIPRTLGFVHVSFIVIPENPSHFCAHYPLPSPLWLSLCS